MVIAGGITVLALTAGLGLRTKDVSQDMIKTVPIIMDSCEYKDGQYTVEYSNNGIYTKATLNKEDVNFSSQDNYVELRTETFENQLFFFGHYIRTMSTKDVQIEPIFYIYQGELALG